MQVQSAYPPKLTIYLLLGKGTPQLIRKLIAIEMGL